MGFLLWRWWRCPRTVEAAAADFAAFLVPGVRAILRAHPPGALPTWVQIDQARILGYRYGLLWKVVAVRPADEDWAPGWNRRLIAAGGGEAQRAAYTILG